jgi:hypothetical protein
MVGHLRERPWDDAWSKYSVERLTRIYLVARDFPIRRRRQELSFSVHEEAGNPEILDAILERKPKGQAITKRYVRAVRDEWLKDEMLKQREQARQERDGPESNGSAIERRHGLIYLIL